MQKAFDLIKKRLDKASDYYECDEQGREHVQMVNLSDAIEIVNQVAEEYKSNDGWIPCSERNPEEKGVDKTYLCCFVWGEVTVCR